MPLFQISSLNHVGSSGFLAVQYPFNRSLTALPRVIPWWVLFLQAVLPSLCLAEVDLNPRSTYAYGLHDFAQIIHY